MSHRARITRIAAALALAVVAGCSAPGPAQTTGQSAPQSPASAGARTAQPAASHATPRRATAAAHPAAATAGRGPVSSGLARLEVPYLGLAALTVSQLPGSAAEYGRRPDLLEVYRTFGTPLSVAHPAQILAYGAMPLIQLNPYHISLTAIADGHYDAYLRSYAAGIKALGADVAISFAAEANGTWYKWGCQHTTPATYIAAWRHVHDVMTAASGNRIIWVWDVNKDIPGYCPLVQRWPGAAYVTWVGLDAYWRTPGDTFATAIAPTIASIRSFTSRPLLIAETGAPAGPAPGWLRSIFTGAKATPGVLGIVWFDYHSQHGDYLLADDPAALAVFRHEAAAYGPS